ncbi:glycyl-radical enzyme activating protein [Desulfuromonas sp. TF]|uniref:glycyl-radical enzyme activating protein n=1 Tax=Desulfuromonas sp. TF TaxID=1232410 RepID=UPI0006882B0B|nr:glycyl-radical enzyme activating protein [Desulfuromonas sp. TF]
MPLWCDEIVGKTLDIGDIVREAVADKIFYEHSGGGITISGGEPLLFPKFSLELARLFKTKENLHIALETSAYADWDMIEPLIKFVDLFIVDIKSMDPNKHQKVIGGSLEKILRNIERLIESQAKVLIHLPIIPSFNDSSSELEAYVKYLSQFSDKLSGVDILPFHSYGVVKYRQLGHKYEYKKFKDLSEQQVKPLFNSLKQIGLDHVTIGGIFGTRNCEYNLFRKEDRHECL